jgi:hypothetical protein
MLNAIELKFSASQR